MSAPERRYGLRRACRKCPFRSDVEPYLRPGRAAEIAQAVIGGAEFPCHETTESRVDEVGDEQRVDGARSRVCAGALGVMVRSESLNQMARIAERVGVFDPSKLDTSTVYASFTEFVDAYIAADPEKPPTAVDPYTGETVEFEHCGVVDDQCEDPPGYGGPGGAVRSTDTPTCNPITDSCESCGSAVCRACRSPEWSRETGQFCSICWNPDED